MYEIWGFSLASGFKLQRSAWTRSPSGRLSRPSTFCRPLSHLPGNTPLARAALADLQRTTPNIIHSSVLSVTQDTGDE